MPNLNDIVTASSGLTGTGLASLGVTGTSLGITPASLGVTTGTDNLLKEVQDGSRHPYHIPTIYTINNRFNTWAYNWNSSSINSYYYNYMNSDSDRWTCVAMGMGGVKSNTLSYSSNDPKFRSKLQFAGPGNVAGGEGIHVTWANNTSYGPIGIRTMFVRNFHPTLSKTVTFYTHTSNYYSAGYEGSSLFGCIPNTNKYSTATNTTFTNIWNRSGGNSYYTDSGTLTIPASTTAMITLTNSMYYWTSSGNYQWADINKFYNLDTTFSDPYIQPDMRMTYTYLQMNDFDDTSYNSNWTYRIWNRAAAIYGDR
jgi:hypothetical protein